MPIYEMTNEQTLANVIQTACGLLSLPRPVDPAGSTDSNIVLMRTAANIASLELLNMYEWADLTKRGEITVVASEVGVLEQGYDLPPDFFRFIDQTQWNDAMRFPTLGPLAPQGWMAYLSIPIGSAFTLTWQMRQKKIWFLNPPPAPGQVFKFMYLSRALVQDADNPDKYKNLATKNGDAFVLDGLLMALFTVVKWLEKKEFDSSAATRDFLAAFDSRVGAQKGANILNMAGSGLFGCGPLIGVDNIAIGIGGGGGGISPSPPPTGGPTPPPTGGGDRAIALTGQLIQAIGGTVGASSTSGAISIGLIGHQLVMVPGTLSVSSGSGASIGLSGQQLQAFAGNVTPLVTGGGPVTVGLTGQTIYALA